MTAPFRALQQEENTVSFARAVEVTLAVKQQQQRASRTLLDIRYYMRRLMLYAGVRPDEVMRLSWLNIDEEEQEVIIPARHSKTGGGRRIAICPALRKLLAVACPPRVSRLRQGRICPRNWRERWKRLRHQAGFRRWVPDVLRHTFASYYVKRYRDMNTLQLYMGHQNQHLLWTRYVNLRTISHQAAIQFWGKPSGLGAGRLRG